MFTNDFSLLLFVCTVVCCFFDAEALVLKQLHKRNSDFHEIIRRTRQASSSECALNCLSEMVTGLEEKGFDSTISELPSSGLVNEKLYDLDHLTSFCSLYDGLKICAQNCSMADAMMGSFSVIDFLCTEGKEEFGKHAECYKKALNFFEQECDQNCGSSNVLEEATESIDLTDPDSLPENTKIICTHIICHINCAGGIIARECENGVEAAKFMRKFVAITFKELFNTLEKLSNLHEITGEEQHIIDKKCLELPALVSYDKNPEKTGENPEKTVEPKPEAEPQGDEPGRDKKQKEDKKETDEKKKHKDEKEPEKKKQRESAATRSQCSLLFVTFLLFGVAKTVKL